MKNPLRNFCIIEDILLLQKEYLNCMRSPEIPSIVISSTDNSKGYDNSLAHVNDPVYLARKNITHYSRKK